MPYSSLDARIEKAVKALQSAGLSRTIGTICQKLDSTGNTFEQLYVDVISRRAGFSQALVWVGLPNHEKHLFFTHPKSTVAYGQHIEVQKLFCGTCQQITVPGQLMGMPIHGTTPDNKYDSLIGYFLAHPDFFVRRAGRASRGSGSLD